MDMTDDVAACTLMQFVCVSLVLIVKKPFQSYYFLPLNVNMI